MGFILWTSSNLQSKGQYYIEDHPFFKAVEDCFMCVQFVDIYVILLYGNINNAKIPKRKWHYDFVMMKDVGENMLLFLQAVIYLQILGSYLWHFSFFNGRENGKWTCKWRKQTLCMMLPTTCV